MQLLSSACVKVWMCRKVLCNGYLDTMSSNNEKKKHVQKCSQKQLQKYTFSQLYDIYGLETVVSVLFSNTRTRLLYNEREIFNTARSEAECSIEISSSLYVY